MGHVSLVWVSATRAQREENVVFFVRIQKDFYAKKIEKRTESGIEYLYAELSDQGPERYTISNTNATEETKTYRVEVQINGTADRLFVLVFHNYEHHLLSAASASMTHQQSHSIVDPRRR